MRWDSPSVQKQVAAHRARGEDPWLLLAAALAKVADLQLRTDGVSELECCWLNYREDSSGKYVGVQCSAPDARGAGSPGIDTLWWDITRQGGEHPHIPLCKDHIEEIARRMDRLVWHGMKDLRHENWQDFAEAGPVVYYIRRIDGMIKIGYSKNLTRRINELRTGTGPVEVIALERGDIYLEKQRHRQFAADCRGGEWFFPSPALIAWMSCIPA